MKTLLITDLAVSAELDTRAMAGIHGGSSQGFRMPADCFPSYPKFEYGKGGIDFSASQMLGQSQNTTVNNGNNVAFASGIGAHVNPTQNGSNNISFM